ncbi:MAG: hypothetical protein LBB82_02890 [Treponema sp.]|jgi:hypothetical protein|nr:hypothetical protein [Treponema sp.]
MAEGKDLYSIICSYAQKIESPWVGMEDFISFLEKYAKRVSGEKSEWKYWSEETGARVWTEMNHLAEAGKVNLISDERGNRAYLTLFYAEQIRDAYRNADAEAGMPFPDEISLKLTVPREQLKPLDVTVDLNGFLEDPQQTPLPIIKLVFPGGFGEALALAPMIPGTIMEFALIKVRNYLHRSGNREYVQHKLAPSLLGKEDHLRETIEKILLRPSDCFRDMKEGRENSFYFWAYFCNLIRADFGKKAELLAEEIGIVQAAYLIEVCNSFFKTRAAKAKEAELAFRNFELEMEKPPYYFSRAAISKFKDNKGVPLLGQYTQEGLDAYIKKRATEPVTPNELPDLLYFHTGDGAAWLVKKSRLLNLCARLFVEARQVVIKTISTRWKKLLVEFEKEPAMENDRDFERLIIRYVEEYAPMLSVLLKDQKLYLVHEEMRDSEKGLPASTYLFEKTELLPLRVLLVLKRKELLSDIKLLMPFWYTIPVISAIVAFFKRLGRRKRQEKEEKETKSEADLDPAAELRNTAREAEARLLPRGYTLESYLEELVQRWVHVIDRNARQNLVEDVNSLVRDRLKRLFRFQKKTAVNHETLDKITAAILDGSHNLRKLPDQAALYLYIKLYLIKLLTRGKTSAF